MPAGRDDRARPIRDSQCFVSHSDASLRYANEHVAAWGGERTLPAYNCVEADAEGQCDRTDEDRAMCGRSRPPKQTARMGQRSKNEKKREGDR
jgi:hypothetical protein